MPPRGPKRPNKWDDPSNDDGNTIRALRFVGVTIAALVLAYVAFLFLYVNVVPMLVNE